MAASAIRMPESRAAPENDGDWADVADKAERRKRQNRLHQRAWRRRKALEASEAALAASDQGKPVSGFWVLKLVAQGEQRQQARHCSSAGEMQRPNTCAVSTVASALPRPQASGFPRGRCKLIPPVLHYVTDTAGPACGTPNPPPFSLPFAYFYFPLPLDHRLLVLVQYNVLRATLTNMAILAILHATDADCGLDQIISHFHPPLPSPAPTIDDLPAALRPTLPQRQYFADHADLVWIGSIPSSAMRDNLIRTRGTWDADDLCCDMLGGLYEGFDDVQRRGMMVWSDPWRADSWEVTEGFAKKWAFLLRGCDDLVAASNRWRARRGEEPLVVECGLG